MPLVTRVHTGVARINVSLLTDIEWVLAMDTARNASAVSALMNKVQAERDAHRDPELNRTLVEESERLDAHEWLSPAEAYWVHRLRGWNRLNRGTVQVDAGALSRVRNLLEALAMSWTGCEEHLDEIEALPADEAAASGLDEIVAALGQGRACLRCEQCRFLVTRERIDRVLDDQGFKAGAYYEAPSGDPEALWKQMTS